MKNSKGFTFIEILVVVFIIGLLAYLVAPNFFKIFPSISLKTKIEEFVTTLRYARAIAITNKSIVDVNIDLDKNKYELVLVRTFAPEEGVSGSSDIENPDEGEEQTPVSKPKVYMPKAKELPEPMELISFSYNGEEELYNGKYQIRFFPKGNSTGGTVRIGIRESKEYLITVDPITGIPKVEKGD